MFLSIDIDLAAKYKKYLPILSKKIRLSQINLSAILKECQIKKATRVSFRIASMKLFLIRIKKD
jgi:hypothetical protein